VFDRKPIGRCESGLTRWNAEEKVAGQSVPGEHLNA